MIFWHMTFWPKSVNVDPVLSVTTVQVTAAPLDSCNMIDTSSDIEWRLFNEVRFVNITFNSDNTDAS